MTGYWDTTGATKTFTHPLHTAWLAGIDRTARVLDYGCGYGRLTAELSDLGFANVSGVDISAALIARGRRARPDLRLAVLGAPPAVDEPAGSFDVVTLFAVLTCVPGDDAQRALIAEVRRVLRPGGLLYVSDLLLQDDDRNRRRYAGFARSAMGNDAPYGVFATDDGAVVRHHEAEHLRGLLAGFDPLGERQIEVATMNGRPASAVQMLAVTRR